MNGALGEVSASESWRIPESRRSVGESLKNGPHFGAQNTLPDASPSRLKPGYKSWDLGVPRRLPGRPSCGLRIASRHIWPLPSANCYTAVRFWVAQAPARVPLMRPTDSESAHMALPGCQLLHYGEILGGPGASLDAPGCAPDAPGRAPDAPRCSPDAPGRSPSSSTVDLQ